MPLKKANGAGTATLLDIMSLQKELYEKMSEVHKEISGIKVRVAVISSAIATATSVLMSIIFKLLN